ncbi:Polyprenol-phosphate-mannose-dependent alpha-(1-2)-phosphatidylinositol mannoside mannosyltransferase [Actinomyces bovis]|uniref:Polyprenol-phosphate-mannose-dependent alpha-(1-2)-phosphatidylinositol mannoside mannosyltransferase n=1 Tax=Actinomyces bovis TaxID=1658 RepID=A0ABY1VRC7_9ACTO|nr:glycosyltransferase 87 family protein [Actinomyces bovis]SPT53593.1 Polyprenol-phosphate-mannose-dependent alpha-(1-2)-phosphatidylinositol mannoside mannosyltransferase [Actinomyces bovis]VEG55617.1 Polyprenol-phosphate-mannose-dependent alpha-(1-2)-phosphatidylinositol mannoside mannosyltransferase [Actinomyces israelii]
MALHTGSTNGTPGGAAPPASKAGASGNTRRDTDALLNADGATPSPRVSHRAAQLPRGERRRRRKPAAAQALSHHLPADDLADLAGPVSMVLGWILLALSCFPMLIAKDGTQRFKFDAWVYYHAIDNWHSGGDLYQWWAFPNEQLYPFTYPPFAAWLMTPLTWLDDRSAQVLLTVATPLCAAAMVLLLARVLQTPTGHTGLLVPWAALATCTLLEPFVKSIEYGQINAILLLLVSVDLLAVRPGGPLARLAPARGALCGIAAAIKLTPAMALLVLLLRREWRAAGVMVGTGLGATLLGAVFSPQETWEFFTKAMLDPTRAGDAEYSGNQNLRGFLVRFLPEAAEKPIWALGVVGVIAAAWMLVQRLQVLRECDCPETLVLLLQTSVVMTLGLLISPISWSHHWVWFLPALVGLGVLACRERSRALLLVCVTGVAVMVMAMHWWLPEHDHVELSWPVWAKVTGSSYTLWALGAGAVLWWQTGKLREARKSGPEGAAQAS